MPFTFLQLRYLPAATWGHAGNYLGIIPLRVSGRIGELKGNKEKSTSSTAQQPEARALRATSVVKFGVTYSLAASSKSRGAELASSPTLDPL